MNIGKECNHIKNVRKLFNKIYCIRSIDTNLNAKLVTRKEITILALPYSIWNFTESEVTVMTLLHQEN